MILRTAGPSSAFHPQATTKLSRTAMTAIGLSLAVHAGVGIYLYTHHFSLGAPLTHPSEDRPFIIETVAWSTPNPPRASQTTAPPTPKPPQEQHLRQAAERRAGP